MTNNSNIDNEDKKEYEEYLQRIEQEIDEEDFSSLDTGIDAIDRTYLFDKRTELLVDSFFTAISYMKTHTSLTEQQIKACINECIRQIEFEEEYPNNPNGLGYVDNVFKILSINVNILKEDPQSIYEFIRHEMTHMLGSKSVKQLFKKPLLISGYSRENVFDINNVKKNEYFNEAAVEMFVAQDEEYREEKVLDYTINTNQDLNCGIYCLNSNLIHQILLARGINKQDFFRGLYDYKKSKQIIGKFNKKTFNTLSSNMDKVYEYINGYYDFEDEIYELQQNEETTTTEEKERLMLEQKEKLEEVIKNSERMIIDKILCPRLKKMSYNEQQLLLSEYEKFIISEKEYFKSNTNYKAITEVKKQENPWFQHIDVEPIVIDRTTMINTKADDLANEIQAKKNNEMEIK